MMTSPKIVLHDDNLMTTAELLAAGYHDKAITRLVRRKVLMRLRQGAYTYPSHWAELDDQGKHLLMSRAVLRNARVPTLLTGASAAHAFGAPVWDLGDDVQIVRLDQRADRREAGRVPHRGSLRVEDATVRSALPVTSATYTALHLITTVEAEKALVVIDGLLRAGETTIEHLHRGCSEFDRHPHSLVLPVVLAQADPRHESAGETRTSWLIHMSDLPKPEPQYEIKDRNGRVIHRVDFAWPELGVFLEFDGKVKYHRFRRPGESIEDAVLREKRREERICEITGWRCIRITWADLESPQRTIRRIAAFLSAPDRRAS
jgi:very-short-patch-repair endonuclease